MIKKVAIFVLGVLFFGKANATDFNSPLGARSSALGGASLGLADVWSTANNQAALGFVESLSAGIYYENRFLLKETSLKGGAFVLPVKAGAFGLNVSSFGYSLYNENQIGLSYGQRLGEKIGVGVQLNYLSTRLGGEYGQRNAIAGAVGVLAKVNKELSIGAHVFNPTKTKLASYNDERIPTIMKLGLNYTFSEKVFLALETEKDMDFSPVVKAGLEYHVVEVLYLRGGISTNPTKSSFGFGLQLSSFKLDVASSFHQTLGLTPHISLIYRKQ